MQWITVGDDDTDEENDSVEPLVAEREGDDEEGDAEEAGHSGDDVDEMFDFLGDGSLSAAQSGSQSGDAAHDRVVSAADDDTASGAFDGAGREEGQILRLQRIFVREFRVAALRLRLARQRRVVHFESARFDDANVGRHTVAEFHFDQIADDQLFGRDRDLGPVADHQRELRHQVLETVHDARAFVLLVEGEDARHHHHHRQHNTQIQLQSKSRKKFKFSFIIHFTYYYYY